MFDGHGHRRGTDRGSGHIDPQTGLLRRFLGGGPERGNPRIPLDKVRKVPEQAFNSTWTVKHEHVVFDIAEVAQVGTHRPVHGRPGVVDFAFLEGLRNGRFEQVTARQQETFRLVLFDQIHQLLELHLAMENLPFPVDHVFLEVEGRGFAQAEILHGIRDFKPHFLRNSEEMVHGIAGSHDYR